MNVEEAAELLAARLREYQATGKPCPSNVTQMAIGLFKCSKGMATKVRQYLSESGRLVVNPIRHLYKIDGKHFDRERTPVVEDEVEKVKTILRRRYKPVVDARTVREPGKVATGTPTELVLGGDVVPYAQCVAAAGIIR